MKNLSLYLLMALLTLVSCHKKEQLTESNQRETRQVKSAEVLFTKEVVEEKAIQVPTWKPDFSILEGQAFFDSGAIDMSMKMVDSAHYAIKTVIKLPIPAEYPTVWNSDFEENEKADRLGFTIYYYHRKKLFHKEVKTSSGSKSHKFEVNLLPSELRLLKPGEQTIEIVIETRYESFFGVKSKVKPLSVKVSLPIVVFEVYKTNLYFHSFKLNPEITMEALGDNDFGNDAPESKIKIMYLGSLLHTNYVKNSFKLSAPKAINIYHTKAKDDIKIDFLDKDGAFNPDDFICGREFSLDTLQAKTYKTFQFDCVDELKIYTKPMGRAN